MYPRLVGETRTHPLLPKRGPPHVTAAPQMRLLPTAVLAGVTWSLQAAPGQPTSLWASCLCLPATSNEVPEGTPCRRGVPGARGSGGLLCLRSASGSGGGVPWPRRWVQISGSWAEAVPLWGAQARGLGMEYGPRWTPQPDVPLPPMLYVGAASGRCNLGRGSPEDMPPTQEGRDRCAVFWPGWAGGLRAAS